MNFDYNTQRKKLRLPEYGRHIQKMIQYVKAIEDPKKRNEQVRAVVGVMGNLNPHLRDIQDFRHKLWDHVNLISDFDNDIDSPYPVTEPATFEEKPSPITYPRTPVAIMHYGRNIENMLTAIADRPEGAAKEAMIAAMAHYMKKQYIMWNKDTVSNELIFKDIELLSKGRIKVDPTLKLSDMHVETPRQYTYPSNNNNNSNNNNLRNKKKFIKKGKGGK
jgi:hypothetical protein